MSADPFTPRRTIVRLIGTPTQARAFIDSLDMHTVHLEQDGPRIIIHAKDLPHV